MPTFKPGNGTPFSDASPVVINAADDSKKVRISAASLGVNTTAVITVTGNATVPDAGGAAAVQVETGAGLKISAMTAAAALTGAEIVPAVQSAANVITTAQAIANLAPACILVESGASSKISALSAAAALSGAETVPILQGGATVAATAANIANAGSGMPSGNANPAQPAYGNNRLFLRTDLGLVIYYDGTRWLTAEQFAAPLSNIVAAEPYGATQVNALWGIVPGVPTYEFYLETLEFTTYNSVITAGTLFFTLALETLNGAGAVTTIARVSGAALSTSGDTQATYIKKITVFNSVIPVTAMMLNVSATKTGGGVSVLYLVGCAFGRKIIT